MFDPNQIKKGVQQNARKVIIYGPPKMGKSTLASAAANTLVLQTEDRLGHINCDKTPVVDSMEKVYEVFDYLMNADHTYKHLVIDTIDWLEPLLHEYIARKNNWKNLIDDHNKETAFFKGLKYHAVSGWRNFLDNLDHLRNTKNISIVLVSHSAVMKIEPPDSASYDKEVMKIDKYAVSVLEEWADVIGFYQREIFVSKDKGAKNGKATTSNKRILHLGGDNPAFISGNSFGFADQIEVELDHAPAIMEYILKGEK